MILTITMFLTATFGLLLVALSIHTSLRRRKLLVAHGDAGDTELKHRIRAHGNFIENAPLLLIITGVLELAQAPQWSVAGIALAFLVARLVHVVGTLYGKGPMLRASAMVIQHTAMVIACLYLMVLVIWPAA